MTTKNLIIRKSLPFFALFFFVTAALAQTTYYVKAGGDDNKDGSSWDNAFETLDAALKAAQASPPPEGNRIYIASGTYKPASYEGIAESTGLGLTPRDKTFLITKTIQIYGGFNAGNPEASHEDRASSNEPTILSGDTDGDGTPDAYHVLLIVGGNASIRPLLDGLTIQDGGGERVFNKSKVGDIQIDRSNGGGIYNAKNADTRLHHVNIRNNKTGAGAGMYIEESKPVLTNVTLTGNETRGGGSGGGICNNNSSTTLTNVTLTGNKASGSGGGGISNYSSSLTLTNVTLTGNNASEGGGIFNYSTSPTLTNVTLTGNNAYNGGGIYNNSSFPIIRNSIIWGNTGSNVENIGSSIITFSHSLIEGCGGSGTDWVSNFGTDAGGNIDIDPSFVSTDDFHLKPGSPAINAGSVDYYSGVAPYDNPDLSAITTDLDGNPLIYRIDGAGLIDMGAYQTVKTTAPPTPPVPPVPQVFTITLPAIQGATTTPAAGKYEVYRGSPFTFSLLVDDDYDESAPRVFAGNRLLEALPTRAASYTYRLEDIYETITIRIEGITKNDPLGIDTPASSGTRVYTSGSTLYVDVPAQSALTVHTLSGQLHTQRALTPGTNTLSLPQGVYIVKVDQQTWKVVM